MFYGYDLLFFPQVSFTPKVDAAANPTREVCIGQTPQGPVAAHPASVNRFLATNGWVVYHEKVIFNPPPLPFSPSALYTPSCSPCVIYFQKSVFW